MADFRNRRTRLTLGAVALVGAALISLPLVSGDTPSRAAGSDTAADIGPVVTAVDVYADAKVQAAVTPLEATIVSLNAEIDRLTLLLASPSPSVSPSPPPVRLLTIGADVNVPTGNTLANFQSADKLIGPLLVRRSFPSVTSIATQVAADRAAGYTSFVSLKPPLTDAQLTTVAKSLPAGTLFTVNHEPENDQTGATFVAMFRHMYTVVKTANPTVLIGPVHLTYAWRNGVVGASGTNTGTQSQAEWDVGDAYRDFTGADTYNAKGGALATDPQFQAWYGYMSRNSLKPLRIVEYGQVVAPPGVTLSAADLTRRAALITADRTWLQDQPRIDMWLLWNGTGAQGNWSLTDPEGQAAWQKVAAGG